jgi:hypothetical protein
MTNCNISCINYPAKCDLCVRESLYVEAKQKKKTQQIRVQKKSQRMGAKFEEQNHEKNNIILSGTGSYSTMTPNSGAGYIKGDEEIKGFVTCKEELKTNIDVKLSRGQQTFTIHKDWLEKISQEYKKEGKEFGYLKFRFFENDGITYVVIENDVLMSMIATMSNDRKKVKEVDDKVEYYKLQHRSDESTIVALNDKIKLLEQKIKLLNGKKYLEQPEFEC